MVSEVWRELPVIGCVVCEIVVEFVQHWVVFSSSFYRCFRRRHFFRRIRRRFFLSISTSSSVLSFSTSSFFSSLSASFFVASDIFFDHFRRRFFIAFQPVVFSLLSTRPFFVLSLCFCLGSDRMIGCVVCTGIVEFDQHRWSMGSERFGGSCR